MKSNLLKIIKYVFFTFITLVFIAGYNSDRIMEALIPKVSVYYASSEDKIKTTVELEGIIKTREVDNIRFSHSLSITEVYVEDGERVENGQPLFKIDNLEETLTIEDEKAQKQLELSGLQSEFKKLTGTTFDARKISLIRDEIAILQNETNNYKTLSTDDASYLKTIETLEYQLQTKEIQLSQTIQAYRNTTHNNEQAVNSLLLQMETLERELMNQEAKSIFYDFIDDEGIYHATSNGIVTDLKTEGYYSSDTNILTINSTSGEMSYVFHGSFDASFAYLIQKNTLIYLDLDKSKPSINARISKVYEPIDGKCFIDAVIEDQEEGIYLGMSILGRSIEKPGSQVNIPRTAIISKGQIKNSARIEFYQVVTRKGVLGETKTVGRSYGTVAYVGDDYIGLSGKTLPDSYNGVIIDNPSPTLKVGDRITE